MLIWLTLLSKKQCWSGWLFSPRNNADLADCTVSKLLSKKQCWSGWLFSPRNNADLADCTVSKLLSKKQCWSGWLFSPRNNADLADSWKEDFSPRNNADLADSSLQETVLIWLTLEKKTSLQETMLIWLTLLSKKQCWSGWLLKRRQVIRNWFPAFTIKEFESEVCYIPGPKGKHPKRSNSPGEWTKRVQNFPLTGRVYHVVAQHRWISIQSCPYTCLKFRS